ncbi:hypothetical protein F3F96_08590 [Mariprofundus sp. NF]|uniref:hypothetical protein n=1 Tax=Mariprofundus sp. NF TaxID=2608716 RepID=UPI0015A314C0|nr:hypothetical protein [Mariprofundus sp. NF]NWF39191.1 hypothetical protein [Mariprofundus sp. NF]
MVKTIIAVIATVTLLLGLVSMLTPIPGGTLIIAASLTALICTSPRARRGLQFLRVRVNWFNKMFFWLENKIGDRITIISSALRQTRPGTDITDSDAVSKEVI